MAPGKAMSVCWSTTWVLIKTFLTIGWLAMKCKNSDDSLTFPVAPPAVTFYFFSEISQQLLDSLP